MRFLSGVEHKGFCLFEDFEFEREFMFLIGRNGAGKTRFLESLVNWSAKAISVDGEQLTVEEVVFIPQSELVPKLEGGYSRDSILSNRKALIEKFRAHKGEFEQADNRNWMAFDVTPLKYQTARSILRGIAEKLGKKLTELTEDEVYSHYNGIEFEMFGVKNLTSLFSAYIARKHENEIAEWQARAKGKDVYFIGDQEFEDMYGREPWLVLNEILDRTFDGKVSVGVPSSREVGAEFVVDFYVAGVETPISAADLSSGEKTLLWLALVLFHTQYAIDAQAPKPKLLLIDEPDAFLHPSMVVNLIGFLNVFVEKFSTKIIITTHSPTTVALAPEKSVYMLNCGKIKGVDRDEAISDLLSGVSHVSVSPDNRRQVYVESFNDVSVYQQIYDAISARPSSSKNKVSLSFVAAGNKTPEELLREKARSIFNCKDPDLINKFVEEVNGVGSCSHVEALVSELTKSGNRTVRGLIDWDQKNKPKLLYGIHVFGDGVCYSIENLAIDPICVLMAAHLQNGNRFSMREICGKEEVGFYDWLNDWELLQESVDRLILNVFKSKNEKNFTIKYVGGEEILTDKRYLECNGHDLLRKILKSYDVLWGLAGKEERIMSELVRQHMVSISGGKFIPSLFSEVFSELQSQRV